MFTNEIKTNALASAEPETDKEFSGSFILESGIYPAVIDKMYRTEAPSGTLGVVFKFIVTKPNGATQNFNQTIWVTNKKKENFYLDKEGKAHTLAGYNLVASLIKNLTSSTIDTVKQEERVFPIYDFNLKKEVPTPVSTIPELLGKTVHLGIQKIRSNKQAKTDDGTYVDTSDEVFKNDIDKLFFTSPKGLATSAELATPDIIPIFHEKWSAMNTGKVKDRYKEVSSPNFCADYTTPTLELQ